MLINRLLQERLGSPLAKPMSFRAKDHMDWIKTRPCLLTGRQSEPHHAYTKGAHANDFLCIPLCHDLHQEIHNIGRESFETKYKTDLDQLIIVTLIERLMDEG